ncbi:hypothetical protein BDN70DRAFT_905367 [Pholiota conissans]|uniref:Uncharacterized protein n=1 Tax=Pholiota conissans TaxID=109636 RepID=A0A9P5Z8A4_9AGAR|nr:hypothetical protein BDN70DRAFT_905367 [Pholiota conissans]
MDDLISVYLKISWAPKGRVGKNVKEKEMAAALKVGNDWTDAELLAYNTSLMPTSPADFFQSDPSLSEATADYLGYLDLATRAFQESSICDFAAVTLRLPCFNERTKDTHWPPVATRCESRIPLTICGETRVAETDDKTILHKPNVEAQLWHRRIAAFQFNNTKRAARGRPILMFGTTPTFYLVPVTRELSDAVKTTQFPRFLTIVLKCVIFADHQRRDGMADTEFQTLALKRFVAFKSLARSYWKQYLA